MFLFRDFENYAPTLPELVTLWAVVLYILTVAVLVSVDRWPFWAALFAPARRIVAWVGMGLVAFGSCCMGRPSLGVVAVRQINEWGTL